MKDNIIRTAVCPLCGRTYHGAPALSREDNKTLICPDCGTRQAWTLPSRSRSSRRSTAIWKAGSVEKFTILLYNKVILVGTNRN